MSSYFVVPLSPSYLDQTIDLLTSIYGRYDKRKENLISWCTDPRFNCMLAIANEKVIASSVAGFDILVDFQKFSHFDIIIADYFDFTKNVGQVLDLSVHPDFRRLGLGSVLVEKQKRFLNKYCDQFIGISWSNGKKDNSTYLFKNNDFNEISRSKTFYQSQHAVDSTCAVCGPNCNCEAILYVKTRKLAKASHADLAHFR